LSSKIGVLIAIGVLTGFVLSLFAWQHSIMVDREGQGVADTISGILDSMASLEAGTVLDISFGRDAGQLPNSINGKPYTINVSGDSVIVKSDGRLWMSKQVGLIIPQNLSLRCYNLTEYENQEYAVCTGEQQSGQGFCVERAMVDISGDKRYVTLVYWEL